MIPADLPRRFLERMKVLLGPDYPAFEATYSQPATHGLRVNTLKLMPGQFEALSAFQLSPLPWSPAGFLITDEARTGKHPYHAAGLYYLQDPHAQAVAEVMAPQPGEKVLDLAAAPGGKTTHIASKMQNQGLLVANEIKTKRVGHLAANLERWGVRNTAIINETPERLAEFFGPFFDRVLVDAPCSGEGMFRKDRAAIEGWSEDVILGCAVRQNAILNYAARLVRPGGWLCYSTCTFAPEENEAVIAHFLGDHPEFDLTSFPHPLNLATIPETKGVRLWPHQSTGEGHFIALVQKTGEGKNWKVPVRPGIDKSVNHISRSVRDQFNSWCRENLSRELSDEPTLVGSRWYAISGELPELSHLRVVHPGWWLGVAKKDRFEPAHALAMGLHAQDVLHRLSLPVDEPEVLQYLRCETLLSPGDKGWVLVTVTPRPISDEKEVTAGFPLGWGKRVQDKIKNHYPRGLQWL